MFFSNIASSDNANTRGITFTDSTDLSVSYGHAQTMHFFPQTRDVRDSHDYSSHPQAPKCSCHPTCHSAQSCLIAPCQVSDCCVHVPHKRIQYTPQSVFLLRPPNPGRLSVDHNVFFSEHELKKVADLCSENYNCEERNSSIADQLRDLVRHRNSHVKWIVACGSFTIVQCVAGRDSVLYAKFGDLYLAVLRSAYAEGRVAPSTDETPGFYVRDIKKLPSREPSPGTSEDITLHLFRSILRMHEFGKGVKICSELREVLYQRDSNVSWLVICGSSFIINTELNVDNPAIVYYGEMQETKVVVVKLAKVTDP
ncbi:hypothetical protein BIW11_08614 [Tropilaelaps mercedesae]|uniref:Uncharacterized protein n=1 Tax=Tropilaelaps mercedesae TaxID=418985 RepID=A0A1V9XNS5_9ACAR|nr:hypothetical protein BIW11_08614 [Tropilaelaps mercedesae]